MLTDEQQTVLDTAVRTLNENYHFLLAQKLRAVFASAAPAEGREALAWRVEWERGGQTWVRTYTNERDAIDDGQAFSGTVTPLHLLVTAPTMSEAERDVLAERKRSVERYGFTAEHDDKYDPGVLASAGLAYAMWAADYLNPYSLGDGDRDREGNPTMAWPWSPEWWKPKAPRVALVKACNLILSEIERIDRAAAKGESDERI
jgi:hypothetical protein